MRKNRRVSPTETVLKPWLISSDHDFKSIGGLTVSAVVSTMGVYGLITPFFTDSEGFVSAKAFIAIFAFIVIVIIFDFIKRSSFTKYLNSLIRSKIINSKKNLNYKYIAVTAMVFFIFFDAIGSYTTSEIGAKKFIEHQTKSSEEYKIIKNNDKKDEVNANNFTAILATWEKLKKENFAICDNRYIGWKPKYPANCKTDWLEKNPMPKLATNSDNLGLYGSLKANLKGFDYETLQAILFVILLILTLLMQYMTISSIYDDYNEIMDELDEDKIIDIQYDIDEAEEEERLHLEEIEKIKRENQREKRRLELESYRQKTETELTKKATKNKTRNRRVKRFSNNRRA